MAKSPGTLKKKKSSEMRGYTAIRQYLLDALAREETESATSAFRAISRVEASHKRDMLIEHFSAFSDRVREIAKTCMLECFQLKAKTSGSRASMIWAEERTRNLLYYFNPKTRQRGAAVDRWIEIASDGESENEHSDNTLHAEWRAPTWALPNPDGLYPKGTIRKTRLDKPGTERFLNKISRILLVTIDRELKSLGSLLKARSSSDPSQAQRKSIRQRKPDRRKVEIAKLKSRYPDLNTMGICHEMDKRAEAKDKLRPPESWQTLTGKRLWADLYQHPRTKNQVSVYVSRILPNG